MFARYAVVLLPESARADVAVQILAVGIILLLSAINYVGVRAGSRLQTALTIVKIVANAGLVVAGLLVAAPATVSSPATDLGPGPTGVTPFLLAMVAGLFAFGGWHMVTYTAGETTLPARTIPVALVAGVLIASLYGAVASATASPPPVAQVSIGPDASLIASTLGSQRPSATPSPPPTLPPSPSPTFATLPPTPTPSPTPQPPVMQPYDLGGRSYTGVVLGAGWTLVAPFDGRLETHVYQVIDGQIREGTSVTYDMKPSRDDPTAVGTSDVADAVIEKLGVRV